MIPPALLACAPNVAPATLEAVIRAESDGDLFAVHVNALRVQPPPAHDMYEAVQTAVRFIVRGYSVDLGLMQVNSRNLPKLGLSVTQVFDPCNNIRTGASILTAAYAAAARIQGDGQPALRAALSAYNTGDFYRGQVNGYVAGYYRPSGVPAIAGGVHENPAPVPPRHDRVAATANPYTADTSIFAREPANVRIE